jgi:hypothetical protein
MMTPKKSRSSECTRIHQTRRRSLKQTLSACQKTNRKSFLGQKITLMVEIMQKVTTIISEVYCENIKELHKAIQKKKEWNADIRYSAPT